MRGEPDGGERREVATATNVFMELLRPSWKWNISYQYSARGWYKGQYLFGLRTIIIIWAIVGRQTKGATVKHVNTRTRVRLNSRAGESETSFDLTALLTLTQTN